MMKNLHIPNPCSESWETMSPQGNGKFCSVCSKCVIDFTEKESGEIESIFKEKQKQGEEICGRFFSDQLTRESEKNIFFQYIPTLFRNNKMALAIVSMILFLTGCSKPKEEACATIGEVKIEEDSVAKNENYILGAPMAPNDSIAKMQKKDSLKLKQQK